MPEEQMEHRKHHRHYGFIPAGVLIGLGVGLLAGYPGPGVLIGLGLGFLATGLAGAVRKPNEAAGTQQEGMSIVLLLLGVFMIFIGIGIVWAPAELWPYIIAGFLILLGVWVLIRGFYRNA
jgi:hypothetical protein